MSHAPSPEAHDVTGARRAFEAALRRDPAANASWLRGSSHSSAGLELAGRSVCSVASPWIMPSRLDRALGAAAVAVVRAVGIVAERAHHDPRVLADLMLPPALAMVRHLEPTPRPPPVLCRVDGMGDSTRGSFRAIEVNPLPGALRQISNAAEVFAAMPAMREVARQHRVIRPDLHRELRAALGDDGHAGHLALGTVASDSDVDHWSLHAFAGDAGVVAVRAPPEHASCRGGSFRLGDTLVTHINVIDWSFLFGGALDHPIVRAVAGGAVRVLNGAWWSVVAGAKTVLAVLSDPAHTELFDGELRATLATRVPWTRSLRPGRTDYRGGAIDLLPFVERHRERFVLKPVYGTGGEGVVLGWSVDHATWRERLEALAANGGVVQERVAAAAHPLLCLDGDRVEIVDHVTDYCPVVWGGHRSAGAMVRASRHDHDLLNVSQGGALLGTLVVDRSATV